MVSGFAFPTDGEVRVNGKRITKPGPDRMVVFQNYALLPWRTAFENIYLAVHAVHPNKPQAEKRAIVREHLALVGLLEAADKKANSTFRWYETADFNCPCFGYSSRSFDFG
jgi:bicarbonate transport system ATP-binding protein